jgi:C1A family cysteine protease
MLTQIKLTNEFHIYGMRKAMLSPITGYKLGDTNMQTKKTSSELEIPAHERILNVLPSKNTENDWRIEHAVEAGILAAAPPIPASVDLRKSWWKIGDQGKTGACVGWATADSVLRWHFVKANRLDENIMLSPRFIWMAAKETDEFTSRPTTFIEADGTSLKAALDVARAYGTVPDTILPFDSGSLFQGEEKTFYVTASQRRIANYINLGLNLDKWREWIATTGPILTRLNVDATWDHSKDTGGHLTTYQPQTVRGGHAVALVGYTPDYFIVRNSWGTSTWGDKGFGYASLGYAQEAFTEAYGVTL